jgi:hypothetical protein
MGISFLFDGLKKNKKIGLFLIFCLQRCIASSDIDCKDQVFAKSIIEIFGTFKTKPQCDSALLHLDSADRYSIINSSHFSSLKPGFFLIIRSTPITSLPSSKNANPGESQESYVRFTGTFIGDSVPGLSTAIDVVRNSMPKNAAIDISELAVFKYHSFPIVIASAPSSKRIHGYATYKSDYLTEVFIFINKDPIKIKKHDFCKVTSPEDTVWENVSIGPVHARYLDKKSSSPFIMYQAAIGCGEYRVHYLIVDENNLNEPYTGTTVYAYDAGIYSDQEIFLPSEDSNAPWGIQDSHLKDKIIIEGNQIQKTNVKGVFKMRSVKAKWDSGKLIFYYGPWM